MKKSWRAIGAVLLCGLSASLASCSSDSPETEGSTSDASTEVATAAGPSSDGGALSSESFETIALDEFGQTWATYLAAHDEAMAGGDVPGDLDSVATAEAIEALKALAAANRERVEANEIDGIVSVASVLNIEDRASVASPQLRDCTEQTIEATNGEVFKVWVDQTAEFVETGDGWLVDSVEVLQDGWKPADGVELGCLPKAFRDEAERVAALFIQGTKELDADPTGELPAVLLEARGDGEKGRGHLERIQGWMDPAVYTDSPYEIASIEALGLDMGWSLAKGPVARVAACVVYPEGLLVRSSDTGEVVREALEPTRAQHVLIDVTITEGVVGEAFGSSPAEVACD